MVKAHLLVGPTREQAQHANNAYNGLGGTTRIANATLPLKGMIGPCECLVRVQGS